MNIGTPCLQFQPFKMDASTKCVSSIERGVDSPLDQLIHNRVAIKDPSEPSHNNNNVIMRESESMDFDDEECCEESDYDEMCTESDDITGLGDQECPSVSASTQLLEFAEMVSSDIQRLFGGKKGSDESCDIYEDPWKQSRSGKELYYAHLMKIAQGIEAEVDDKLITSNSSYSGKRDRKAGLGPLKALFEYGLKDYWKDESMARRLAKMKKFRMNDVSGINSASLNGRKLPESFWAEPKVLCSGPDEADQPNRTLSAMSKTPDFSDLLESWTAEEDHSQITP